MAVYRTPGVYVEEIQTIPPAVAAVATAIPCFFGYTQNATLAGQPTKIGSLLEFEEKFGGSPVQQIEHLYKRYRAPFKRKPNHAAN